MEAGILQPCIVIIASASYAMSHYDSRIIFLRTVL